jgi:hypothetical protein
LAIPPPTPFVEQLQGNKSNPPYVILIAAYVGLSPVVGEPPDPESSDDPRAPADHTKVVLYADPELRKAVVVNGDDVLHWAPSNTNSPAAPTLLWIKSDARTSELPGKSVRAWFQSVAADDDPVQPIQYVPVYPVYGGDPNRPGSDWPSGSLRGRGTRRPPC